MTADIESASSKPQKVPWLLEYRSSDWFILTTVCCAIFTVSLSNDLLYFCLYLTWLRMLSSMVL